MKTRPVYFLHFILILSLACLSAPTFGKAQDNPIRASRLGITFISSLDHPSSEQRYQRALLLGAGWNRWPLYWDKVETSPGSYDWSGYDGLVNADLQHGLRIDAILLGRPAFQQQGGSIVGLETPVFSDGTDEIGTGKTPNPANPFAMFVYQAVNRFKPGGLLAAQQGWPPDWGITVWEAWNEPDFPMFWNGGVEDYARLLKVAYLAAHQADPNARVMFGGLSYSSPDQSDWLARVLDIFAADPARDSNHWFMDLVAVHNYTNPARSGVLVKRAKDDLAQHGFDRPVWLNESGVAVWNDYPGPTWTANDPASHVLRATMQQQANFIVQSTVYAWAAGADVVFFHQLYDDCGNQAYGTNFSPNTGETCLNGTTCWGDAYGLYRNDSSNACFTQNPLPGTPRPGASAFYLLAQVFGTAPFGHPQFEDVNRNAVVVSFDRPFTGERIRVLWNRSLNDSKLRLPAAGDSGQLYSIENQTFQLAPTDGRYEISLPGATRDDYPYLAPGEVSAIGGQPFILVEKIDPNLNLALIPVGALPLQASIAAPATTVPPRPTVDPAFDTKPPTATIGALPAISSPTFTVYWSGQDDSGIKSYLVWVREDGGTWQPWLETPDTQGEFTGESGHTYEFAAWAQDLAGNWSTNTELTPQAVTSVQ